MQSEVMGKTLAIIMVIAMISTGIAMLPTGVEAEQSYTIKGKVLNNVGDVPLAGVYVNISVETVPATTWIFESVMTGTDGTFSKVFMLDNACDFNISFEKVGFAKPDNRTFDSTLFDANNTANTEITLLFPQDLVKGKVFIMGTTTPIEDVEVNVEGNAETISTDSYGKFAAYTSLPEVDIDFSKDGYYSTSAENVAVDGSSYDDIYYMEKITPVPTIKVYGIVTKEGTNQTIDGAYVSISEGDEKWITARSDDKGRFSMLAYPGNFQIKAYKEGYFTTFDATYFFSIPGDEIQDISLEEISGIDRTFSGTISCSDAASPDGAVAYLYSDDGKFVDDDIVDGTGVYSIDFYAETGVTFILVVEKDGYFTNVAYTDIVNGAAGQNVVLEKITPIHKLFGKVFDATTNAEIIDASITIYANDSLYTDMTESEGEGYYEFTVYDHATFWMAVDAEGFQSVVKKVLDITEDTVVDFGLQPSGSDIHQTTFEFLNWTTISVKEMSIISVDNMTVRLNADRKYDMQPVGLGQNDGSLDSTDIGFWEDYLAEKGLEQRDTKDFLTLNNTYYKLDSAIEVEINGATGSVTEDATIFINMTYTYTIVPDSLENIGSTVFTMVLNATYDTEYLNHTYDIVLPKAADGRNLFEMTKNVTETSNVDVIEYNNPITVNPKVFDGDSEKVIMTIMFSDNGTANAKVLSGVHYVMNSTYDNYTVIVPKGPISGMDTNITFSAEESTDKIGDITKANFTWNFGDGTTGYGIEVDHEYTAVDGLRVVRLVVNETGGNLTWRNITVYVDSQNPVAGISAVITDSENISFDESAKILTVNEDLPIKFSGIKFTDADGMGSEDIVGDNSTDLIATGKDGIIEKWYWSWGEEEVSDETITKDGSNNITHSYNKPGEYTLNLTVTDVVGRESANATWIINVLDVTAPLTDFNIKDEDGAVVTEVIENTTFYFNASLTTDNFDEFDNLSFHWFFDVDGTVTNKTGDVVNFTFGLVGDFNVTLKATDDAGNYYNKTTLVHVNLAERPNILMKIGSMVFSSSPGTAGKEMTVSVNITNDGKANASDIQTKFYIRNSDGTDTEIGTVSTASLIIGNTTTVSIEWTPSKKGEYSIWANSTCAGEHSSQWWDNKIDDFSIQKVTVDEAAWVMPAIIIAIVVVIIVVFVGMKYFMKSGTEKDETGDKRKKR
ncbi:MAG: PKD domain-containing protein [Thermoplasmata archaeon]|nr:PKD domain-containing protein [Thermoplasmata archaeon]